jgi:CheY-like chemotaxis protein
MSDTGHRADILIIDDDSRCRASLESILEMEGYRVACAADGLEALTYLRQRPAPALILLDLAMPVMDGWQFRQQQRQDPALAGIPVVVMTGAADRDQEALAVAAAGYFLKPYDIRALLELVGSHCPGPGSASSGSLDLHMAAGA